MDCKMEQEIREVQEREDKECKNCILVLRLLEEERAEVRRLLDLLTRKEPEIAQVPIFDNSLPIIAGRKTWMEKKRELERDSRREADRLRKEKETEIEELAQPTTEELEKLVVEFPKSNG